MKGNSTIFIWITNPEEYGASILLPLEIIRVLDRAVVMLPEKLRTIAWASYTVIDWYS